nr:amino-acid N-acetyltransferase [Treponema sp.]
MDNSSVQKAQNIRDVIRYLQKFKNALVVIYLDDKIINSPLFSSHIRDIALLHKAGLKVVIIPGAKQRIDQVLQDAKIQWNYKDNIRVTNQEAMPLIKMAAFDVSNIVMTSLAANNIT